MKRHLILMVLLQILISGSAVFGEDGDTGGFASLIYDITVVNNLEAGVGTVVYIRTPSKVVAEEGTAIFTKQEFRSKDYYIYAYNFKTTGTLLIKDRQGNGLTIRVISPEEEQKAQDLESRLETCLTQRSKLEPLVSDLEDRVKSLESNLSYYKRVVEENHTIVETKYVMGEEEWRAAMIEWRNMMSFRDFAGMFIVQLFFIFLAGVLCTVVIIFLFFRRIRFVPAY